MSVNDVTELGESQKRVKVDYTTPGYGPLDCVRIVQRFPWGGQMYSFMGKRATIVGMEARIAVVADAKYGNDHWDYKLEVEGGEHPPVWLPSSCIEPT